MDLVGVDHAVWIVLDWEDGIGGAVEDFVVYIEGEDATDTAKGLAVAGRGCRARYVENFLEVGQTGDFGVGCSVVGHVLGGTGAYGCVL